MVAVLEYIILCNTIVATCCTNAERHIMHPQEFKSAAYQRTTSSIFIKLF